MQSGSNVADIGTRKGAQIKDVYTDSVWRSGYTWVTLDESDFPTMTVSGINFKNIKQDVNTEMLKYGKALGGM